MSWTAWGICYAVSDPTVAGRRQIRPPDCSEIRGHERMCKVLQPVRVGIRVVIDVSDDLPGGRMQPQIARAGETAILHANELIYADARRNFGDVVFGAIVYDDGFEVGIVKGAD